MNIGGTLSADMPYGFPKSDGRSTLRIADPRTLAGRVQLLREAREWTQAQLAKESGLSQATVANIERGKTTGGLALTIAKIASALNVDPEWLRTGKGQPINLQSDTETDLLTVFRQLSPSNRAVAIGMLKVMAASQHKK